MSTNSIWSCLRAAALDPPSGEEGDTEKMMAIKALGAAYQFLLDKETIAQVEQKVPLDELPSMDVEDGS
jgi:hypothetical protein